MHVHKLFASFHISAPILQSVWMMKRVRYQGGELWISVLGGLICGDAIAYEKPSESGSRERPRSEHQCLLGARDRRGSVFFLRRVWQE